MTQTLKQLLVATLCSLALLAGLGMDALTWLASPAQAAAPQLTQLDPEQRNRAIAFIDALDQGRYDDAQSMLAPAAAEALKGQLEPIWTALPKQVGKRTGRSEPRAESVEGIALVTITLNHAAMSLDARVHFDGDLQIDGFRIVPSTAPAAPAALEKNAAFEETEVQVVDLPATLSLPKAGQQPFPAAILVHGSGPHDRDETIGPNMPFRDLAHGLAERGVAVIRYDKRTKARPETFSPTATLDDEVINDAVHAISLLQKNERIDAKRIIVVGHSLGAMAAPRIIARSPQLAGAVLLAGNARPLQELVVEQVSYLAHLDDEVNDEEKAQLERLRKQHDALDAMANGADAPSELMLGLSEPYWRDLLAYDPAEMASKQSMPLLILQGERDYQVTLAGDFARWKDMLGGRDNVTFKSYPTLNHLFIAGEGLSNPQEYFVKGTVDTQVMDDIARFIEAL